MIPVQWIESIITWAERIPEIKAVYLYGSRVTGSPRDDSDLDIAVVMADGDEGQRLADLFCEAKVWRKQLQKLIPVKVHLEVGDDDLAPKYVALAIRDHGVKVFPRNKTKDES